MVTVPKLETAVFCQNRGELKQSFFLEPRERF